MELAWIGLGANLGDARATIKAAIARLASLPGTRLCACSSLYQSAPVDAQGDDFINCVVRVETDLDPLLLLNHLLDIEQQFGRQRPHRNAPRTLDLDLLLVGTAQLHTSTLELPHPRMHQRAFVLMPLLEIDPEIDVPGKGSASDLVATLRHQTIHKLDNAAPGKNPAGTTP